MNEERKQELEEMIYSLLLNIESDIKVSMLLKSLLCLAENQEEREYIIDITAAYIKNNNHIRINSDGVLVNLDNSIHCCDCDKANMKTRLACDGDAFADLFELKLTDMSCTLSGETLAKELIDHEVEQFNRPEWCPKLKKN